MEQNKQWPFVQPIEHSRQPKLVRFAGAAAHQQMKYTRHRY